MRTASYVLIVLALAAVVAFAPLGGVGAEMVGRALSLAFILIIALGMWWGWRRFGSDLERLTPGYQALGLGSIGLLVLTATGWSQLTGVAPGLLGAILLMPKKTAPPAASPTGFDAPPADSGLSIDRLAQAFAAMMGTADPYCEPAVDGESVVRVDASPDLDEAFASPTDDDASCRVSPLTILEALLFVGLPGGRPITSRKVAGLMRSVRPQEVDDLADELRRRYLANNCGAIAAPQRKVFEMFDELRLDK